MSEGRTHIISSSLTHYYDSLIKLAEEDIPVIIKNKLNSEMTMVKDILEIVKTKGITYRLENDIRFLDIPDNRNVICSALKSYFTNLRKSSSDIDSKLGNISLGSDSVKDEIQLIEKALKDICGISSEKHAEPV